MNVVEVVGDPILAKMFLVNVTTLASLTGCLKYENVGLEKKTGGRVSWQNPPGKNHRPACFFRRAVPVEGQGQPASSQAQGLKILCPTAAITIGDNYFTSDGII